jgi:hypothetical protein
MPELIFYRDPLRAYAPNIVLVSVVRNSFLLKLVTIATCISMKPN